LLSFENIESFQWLGAVSHTPLNTAVGTPIQNILAMLLLNSECCFIRTLSLNNVNNVLVLFIRTKAFPIVKSMSNNLQHYAQARLTDKITELQQHGGDVEWSENSVIVTGTELTL